MNDIDPAQQTPIVVANASCSPRTQTWLPVMVVGLALLALTAAAGNVHAQGITATIDRTEATVEDQLLLTLTVEGSQAAEPQLPDLPGFQVMAQGRQSQISIVNGRTTATMVYNYLLVPKQAGTFTIGEARVEIGGVIHQSRPFQVRIVAAAQQPDQSRDLFLQATVSTTKPYVGQQVVFTWRFYRRVQLADAQLQPLEFDGFLVEDLGELREYRSVVGGQQYLVSELRKALFPQEEGTLTIGASAVTCQVVVRSRGRRGSMFDDFFGRTSTQHKVVRSQPITLEVQSLPPPPAGFSGLVGDFNLKAQLSKRTLKVGESTTLTLTVSGTGNVQMIGEPALPDLGRFKIYDDKPGGSVDRTGNALSGQKTFSKALVPLEPGELPIAPITLTYFDPKKQSYATARTHRFTLDVSPADGKEELRLTESLAPSGGKVAVRILADDILPLSRGLNAIAGRPLATRPVALFAAALLAPMLIYAALLVTERRRRRFDLDAGLKRRRSALRNARRGLAELRGVADDDGDERAVAQIGSRCLRTYIGDKLGIEGSALTPKEVRQYLLERSVGEELVERVHRLLDRLEAAQYGAATVDAGRLGDDLKKMLASLERQIKG